MISSDEMETTEEGPPAHCDSTMVTARCYLFKCIIESTVLEAVIFISVLATNSNLQGLLVSPGQDYVPPKAPLETCDTGVATDRQGVNPQRHGSMASRMLTNQSGLRIPHHREGPREHLVQAHI